MTDNEIIKAFEVCYFSEEDCSECPFCGDEMECTDGPDSKLLDNIRDLINRQKSDIEKKDIEIDILIRKKETLKDEVSELRAEIERLTEALDGETVENMRLGHEVEILRTNNNSMCISMPNIAKAERAEAIKEFADRLKREAYIERGFMTFSYDAIENLVKEMTENDFKE